MMPLEQIALVLGLTLFAAGIVLALVSLALDLEAGHNVAAALLLAGLAIAVGAGIIAAWRWAL